MTYDLQRQQELIDDLYRKLRKAEERVESQAKRIEEQAQALAALAQDLEDHVNCLHQPRTGKDNA